MSVCRSFFSDQIWAAAFLAKKTHRAQDVSRCGVEIVGALALEVEILELKVYLNSMFLDCILGYRGLSWRAYFR